LLDSPENGFGKTALGFKKTLFYTNREANSSDAPELGTLAQRAASKSSVQSPSFSLPDVVSPQLAS